MKNCEKYKTAEERAKAFDNYCLKHDCTSNNCPLEKCHSIFPDSNCCLAYWLELEAEEEHPLPCPFCGGEAKPHSNTRNRTYWVQCNCGYESPYYFDENEAISAHNKVAIKAKGETK